MTRTLVSILALCAVLAGCGGSDEAPATGADPESAIRSTIEAYQVGIWEGDDERACAQLAPGALDAMLASDVSKQTGITDCAGMVEQVSAYEHALVAKQYKDPAAADRFMQPLLRPKDLKLKITGSTAVARPFDEPIPLAEQDDGSWRITRVAVPG
ncbi:MAG: hypothetical protein WKF94_02505 [Solirubrobacteraceae bacterium]